MNYQTTIPVRKSLPRALQCGLIGIAVALPAQADTDPDLYAYEGFDYPVETSVETQGGGFGWASNWSFRAALLGGGSGFPIFDATVIMPGSLGYDGLETSGNHLHMYGDLGTLELARRLAQAIPSEAGTRFYTSFIGQRVGPAVADPNDTSIYPDGYPYGSNLYPRGAAVRFYNNANGERLSFGMFSNRSHGNWMIWGQGLDNPTEVPFTELSFVVIRVDFNGDSTEADDIYVWLNPQPEDTDNTATADLAFQAPMNGNNPVNYAGLTVVSLFAGNSDPERPHAEMLLDELRIGRTWASVTPGLIAGDPVDPEPGFYVDSQLGQHYYYGQGWAAWMPEGVGSDWGLLYLAERANGWIYHHGLGWLYPVGAAVESGLYLMTSDSSWVFCATALSLDSYYSYTRATFVPWAE